MEDIVDKRAMELESRISSFVEEVENQPQEWYKLLIERVVTQELLIEDLTKEVKDLKSFEQINSAVIESKLLSPTVVTLEDTYEIKASNTLLPDQGFYNIETTKTGVSYRWTKQNFSFDIPLNRESEKTVEIYLLSSIKPELLDNIECYVDGVSLGLEKTTTKQGVMLTGILEPATVSHITNVSFFTTAAYIPKELNSEVEDTRELAVTFAKLTIS